MFGGGEKKVTEPGDNMQHAPPAHTDDSGEGMGAVIWIVAACLLVFIGAFVLFVVPRIGTSTTAFSPR